MKRKVKKEHHIIELILGLVISVMLVHLGVHTIAYNVRLTKACTAQVEATVTKVEKQKMDDNGIPERFITVYFHEYTYSFGGKEYTVLADKLGLVKGKVSVGDKAVLNIAPEAPQIFYRKGERWMYYMSFIFTVLGVLLTVKIMIGLIGKIRRKNAK